MVNPQTQDTMIVNDTTIIITDISDTYKVVNFNQPLTLGSFSFDSTLTVIQKDDSTLTNIDRRKEIYAANVGLVYKDSTVANFCNPSICDFPVIEFGRKSRQIIIGYGKL